MGGELLGFTARLLFGPLWEGAPAGAGGGESLDLSKALGSGMALSLRRFAPPFPFWHCVPPPPYRGSLSRRGRLYAPPQWAFTL